MIGQGQWSLVGKADRVEERARLLEYYLPQHRGTTEYISVPHTLRTPADIIAEARPIQLNPEAAKRIRVSAPHEDVPYCQS